MARRVCVSVVVCGLSLVMEANATAQSALAGETIRIGRASGSIAVDGDLSDEGWRDATRVVTWYEVSPGDNSEPPVKSIGYLAYDSRFLYVGFDFEDPNPTAIRAPLGDHDNISGDSNDMAGIFIDALNSGRTANEFFVNARNVQYDAVTDDASGENGAPDYFWDSATKITSRGWTAEMRIPFSSLRYLNTNPQTWGVILFRNYPRGYRYQITSAKLPRGGNCLVCRENLLMGLEGLPGGGHLVAAPYASASQASRARDDVLGAPLVSEDVKPHIGLDLKYTPNANTAVDLTLKPDFSQVESDTAQISANERFALSFPEKRPFFLESADLFQTPLQAVYTRTITSPNWGGRVTGKQGGVRYTVLVADDEGGGSAIVPGPNESSFADQDFGSTVFVARAKRDFGLSFVSVLATDRENRNGEGHSRLVGPDFQWRPSSADVVTGQLLYSESQTPNRPSVADEWDGRSLSGGAVTANWNHSTTHFDSLAFYKDISDGFRADAGFIPQVGLREAFGFVGWTVRPKGFLSRQRTFLNLDYQAERNGELITRTIEPGMGMDTRLNGFMQFRFLDDRTRAGDVVIGRKQFGYYVRFSPSRVISTVTVDGNVGTDIDFANARPARGATVNLSATLHPTDHLELALLQNQRFLNVDTDTGLSGRFLTQRVSRVRGTYTFTSRLFARVIAQYVATTRDPLLSPTEVSARSGEFSGSALLAYKINWQSVMFVGYGDERELNDRERFDQLNRQFFVKLSYAFQR
jgi:Domain of unknown function (DUF5916)/Carbohydrate family 9 binding domain-like